MPNSSRDVYGTTRRARAKKRAPQPPPVAIRDSGVQSDANRVRTPPRSTSAFGPPRRADSVITAAQRAARARTNRAARKVNRGVSIAAVPRLRNATPAQRALGVRLVTRSARGLAKAGVTPAQLPSVQAQRLQTALGYQRQSDRASAMGVGYQALVDGRVRLGRQDLALLRAHPRRTLERIGRAYSAQHAVGQTVAPDRKTHLLGLNIDPIIGVLKSATSLDTGDLGPRQFVNNALGDVKAVATFPAVAGYELGAGGFEAVAHGDTSRLQRLGEGVLQGLDKSVPGQLVLHGDLQGAERAFLAHPVIEAMNVAGAGAVVGRTVGGLARTLGSTADAGGIRGALAREGSTLRPAIGLNEDGGVAHVQRSYSKDYIRKQLQVRADNSREWLLKDPSKPATRDNIVHVADPRSRKPVPVMRPRGKLETRAVHARRTDFQAGRANAVERMRRERAAHDVAAVDRGGRVRGRVGRRGRAIVSMVTEGEIRPGHFKADVAKRIRHYEAQLAKVGTDANPYRHMGEVKKAREKLADLRHAAKLSDEQVGRVEKAGRLVGRGRRAQDAEYQRLGIAPGEQLDRAALEPYASAHMGARHVTVEEHKALERDARQVERQARAAVDAAPKGSAVRARALADYRRARDHRIAVSGRHPGDVVRHENAARQAGRAAAAVKRVDDQIAKAERRRQQIIGTQRSRRASAPHNVAKGKRALVKVEGEIKALKGKRTAAAKAARDARVQADAAKLPDTQAAVRNADGSFLSNKDIEAHMRAHGVDPAEIGQLTHKTLGNRAFHKRFDVSSRPAISGQRRTLSAFEKGSSGHGRDQVEESVANAATTIAKAEQIDRFVTDNGLKSPAVTKALRGLKLTKAEQKIVDRGGGFTGKEAVELADRLEHDTGRAYVAVRMFGARLPREVQAKIAKLQGPRAFEELSSKLLKDRVVDKDTLSGKEGARNVALVPADQFNRLARHMAASGELEKIVQMLNRPFRFSVLAQPRWLAGNFIEPYFVRLPASGSGVVNIPGMAVDIARSMRTLRSMERSGDPKVRAVAAEIRAQQLGGLFLGGRGATNRRVMRDFEPKPGAGPIEAAAGGVLAGGSFIRNMPVVKQMVDLLQIPPTAYFKANRVLIEQWAQHASLGRSIRKDLEELNGSWMRAWSLGQKAIADAQAGLMHTATQERFMRAQHELLGKYEGFSPGVRRLVQTVAPFMPWALSAARFTFWTMPAHHTILTSLLVKTAQSVDQAWEAEHKDVPPGGLKLAVRAKDGGWVDLARYTPYGFSGPIVEGDPQGITDQFLPQVSGAVAALGGHDPFNRDLRVKPTKGNPQGIPSMGQKLGIAAYGLLESLGGPYWSLARRLQEKGGTAYADSTVFDPKIKPGSSHMSALSRTMNVFRETYLKAPTGKGSVSQHPEIDRIREQIGRARGVLDDPEIEKIREQIAAGR